MSEGSDKTKKDMLLSGHALDSGPAEYDGMMECRSSQPRLQVTVNIAVWFLDCL